MKIDPSIAALRRRIQALEIAASNVLEAYTSRFETRPGTLLGPIDEQIMALRDVLNPPHPKRDAP